MLHQAGYVLWQHVLFRTPFSLHHGDGSPLPFSTVDSHYTSSRLILLLTAGLDPVGKMFMNGVSGRRLLQVGIESAAASVISGSDVFFRVSTATFTGLDGPSQITGSYNVMRIAGSVFLWVAVLSSLSSPCKPLSQKNGSVCWFFYGELDVRINLLAKLVYMSVCFISTCEVSGLWTGGGEGGQEQPFGAEVSVLAHRTPSLCT